MKTTKVLSLLLTAAMLLAALPLGVWAESASSDFEYTITDGEVTITGYTGEGGNVVVPSEIEGYPVTVIGEDSFSNCFSLISIVIPDSVTNIKAGAFFACQMLTSISLPDNIACIEDFTFFACSSLSNITIPHNVLSIGEGAFSNCTSLTNIAIPNSVISIGTAAFTYCSSLANITISASVTSIGEQAFAACASLTSIVIPDNVTNIKGWIFYNCNALTDIYCEAASEPVEWASDWLAGSTATVHWGAFAEEPDVPEIPYTYKIANGEVTITYYTGEGSDVVIPSELEGYPVTGIGDYAFSKNELITSVVIPYGVKYIGVDAFMDCWNLQSVVIPDSVVSIGTTAFSYCESLTAITIPASVATIGESAFYCCNNMDVIYCLAAESSDGWAEYWDNGFYGNIYLDGKLHKGIVGDWRVTIDRGETTIVNYSGDDANVVIPSEIEGCPVTTIGWGAFERMHLVSVTFPDTVRTISKEVFYLTNVETVWIPASVEYVGSSLAYGCDVDIQIYCEVESQPEGWDNNWATDVYYDKPLTVHWGDFAEEPDVPTDNDNLALGKDYIISQQFHQGGADVWWGWDENAPISYPDEGGTLTDGIRASFDTDYLDPIWAAFNVNCPEYIDLGYSYITVDLGEICSVSEILLEFYNPKELGIATPYQGNFYISKNGVDMEWIGGFDCIPENDPDDVSTIGYINETSVDARYIHVCFKMTSWAFLSEIEVYGKKEQPPVTLGDVTGDGKINSADVSHLMRYFADLDYATGTSTVEIGDSADCNGDGVLDGRDVVRLLRYLANRDPLTGESDVELGK